MIALVYDVSRPETFIKCKQTLAKVRHIICPSKLTPGVCVCVCVYVCIICQYWFIETRIVKKIVYILFGRGLDCEQNRSVFN